MVAPKQGQADQSIDSQVASRMITIRPVPSSWEVELELMIVIMAWMVSYYWEVQANPPGMQVSFTVVVSFHPNFITRQF